MPPCMHIKFKIANSNLATFIGILALLFWAASASLVLFVGVLPVFEMQFILFSFSFMLALIIFRGSLVKQLFRIPFKLVLFGVIGIYFTNLFFMSAFQHAPADKVDLINYLWPIMVIITSSLLPNEKLKLNQLVGGMIAFYGVYILLTNGHGLSGFNVQHWKGYLLAFLDALCWTFFTLTLRRYKKSSAELIGIYCGLAALFSLITHCGIETFVMPNTSQICYLGLIGLTSQGLAYYFWDIGIKRGHYKILCVLSYFNPILSIGMLVIFGFTVMTSSLTIAVLLVSLGAVVASQKFSNFLATLIKTKYPALFHNKYYFSLPGSID